MKARDMQGCWHTQTLNKQLTYEDNLREAGEASYQSAFADPAFVVYANSKGGEFEVVGWGVASTVEEALSETKIDLVEGGLDADKFKLYAMPTGPDADWFDVEFIRDVSLQEIMGTK